MDMYESEFTEEHFSSLGKMNIYFQQIEQQIDLLLSTFISPKQVLNNRNLTALLTEISFKTKFSVLMSIIKEVNDFNDISKVFEAFDISIEEKIFPRIITLKSLFKDIEKCSITRNKYMHSHWIDGGICSGKESVARYKGSAKGKAIKGELVFETENSLNEHCIFIKNTFDKLLTCTQEIMALSYVSINKT